MITEHFTLSISPYDIHGMWFLPEGNVNATAFLIHGQGDFIARYHEVAEIFTFSGIAICGIDLPGHGESSGRRGDISSIEYIEHIFQTLRATIEHKFPHRERGLIGHSMGGLLALRELACRGNAYDFTWLSSPLIKPSKNKRAIEIALLKILAHLIPKFTIGTGVKRKFCRRKKIGADLKSNPLFHKKVSLRWGLELIKCEEEMQRLFPKMVVSTKTLITQGTADCVTPVVYLEHFLDYTKWKDLNLEIIQGALHEPFRDITKEECFRIIKKWLETSN